MKEQATEDVLCDRLIMWLNRDHFLYSPLQESKPQLLDGPPRCAEWLLEHIRPGPHGLGPIGFWDYFKVGSLTGFFPKVCKMWLICEVNMELRVSYSQYFLLNLIDMSSFFGTIMNYKRDKRGQTYTNNDPSKGDPRCHDSSDILLSLSPMRWKAFPFLSDTPFKGLKKWDEGRWGIGNKPQYSRAYEP